MRPSNDFFAALGRRGYEPLLHRANGTLRVDLVDGKKTERWLVSVAQGEVTVSEGGGDADCVLRARRDVFDRLASGRANALVALLRGDLQLDGDYNLGVLFQRLFPGPPGERKRRRAAAARRT